MTSKSGSTFTAGPAVVSVYGSFRTLVRSGDENTGRKIAITWVGMPNPKRGPDESRDAYHERCRATELKRARQNEANATFIAESFTVAHETGLTPRQLAEQRDELLTALRAAERKLIAARSALSDANISLPLTDEIVAVQDALIMAGG